MTRLITVLLLFLVTVTSRAQELTVKSFCTDPMDLSAAAKPVSDLNGKACALVKVQLAVRDAKFEGNIVGDVRNDAGEYWVYMTEGSYWLKVKHADYLPLEVNFRDYGVRRVMSKQTYVLTLLRPDGASASASSAPAFSNSRVPEAVDLGLSVKWASFNLGASKPEGSGNYYKWGETEPADSRGWSSYKYAEGGIGRLTKYCSDSQYGYNGFTDGKTVLEAGDDVATVNLGGVWRMPTEDEIQELLSKCKQEWTTEVGVNGIRVTGPNGNTIFLPAAGNLYYGNGTLYDAGSVGHYWAATSYSSNEAYILTFDSGHWNWNAYASRANGYPIRPVLGK